MAAAIRRAALTSRDAGRLVTLFAKTSGAAQQSWLLEHPREALEAHAPPTPWAAQDPRLGPSTDRIRQGVMAAMRTASALAFDLDRSMPVRWTDAERAVLAPLLGKARGTIDVLLGKITDAERAARVSDAA